MTRLPVRKRPLTALQQRVLERIEDVVPYLTRREARLPEYTLDGVFCAWQIRALLRDRLIVPVVDGPPHFVLRNRTEAPSQPCEGTGTVNVGDLRHA